MRKKPEYRAACGGDEWQARVWGCNPMKLFPLKDTPLLAAGFFILDSPEYYFQGCLVIKSPESNYPIHPKETSSHSD
jgi:hypothetical protein